MSNDPRDIEAVALLDEPVRRTLYDWVVLQPEAVSRDAAAAATGIARSLAAFHLDRLVRDGLLTTEFRRLSGRSGPGAGRPAKLYRRSDREVAVTLPARRYEVAAGLLAAAVERATGDMPPAAVRDTAFERGYETGRAARAAAGPRPGRDRRRAALLDALAAHGYEPRVDGAAPPATVITLANCPFHALVDEHRELVCGMNVALASGLLEGLGAADLHAELDPAPRRCCVVIRDAGTSRLDGG